MPPLNTEDDFDPNKVFEDTVHQEEETELEDPSSKPNREDPSSKPNEVENSKGKTDNVPELSLEDKALAEQNALDPRRLALPLPGHELQLASPAYRRMLERMKNDVELYKLHVKHYHMSPVQFRRRTSMLNLPDEIYTKYEMICKGCKI